MRLIDADALFEYIQKEKAWKQDTIRCPRYDKGKYDAYYEMLEIIKKQPTVDAVHAVKCAECKLHENCTFEETFITAGIAESHRYCGAGTRKDDSNAKQN